jgi:predicted AAA+ superfamily ATPase
VRQLQPWLENVGKRQVKSPKVYSADSGLLDALLNLTGQDEPESHPKVGASREGFVIDQLVRHVGVAWEECFFWRTHNGAELDLLVVRGINRLGFEVNRTSSPKICHRFDRRGCRSIALNQGSQYGAFSVLRRETASSRYCPLRTPLDSTAMIMMTPLTICWG